MKFSENRVYLTGPMTGLPNDNRDAFRHAAAALRSIGLEVISPDELDQTDPARGHSWADSLVRDLPYVLACGVGVCLPGWKSSRGARLETVTLAQLGRKLFELDLSGPEPRLVPVPPDQYPRIHIPTQLVPQ